MSKHLRFGKLLSLLAILLTLSFAWGQAQNLSSEKQLLTFGFTTAANSGAGLTGDVTGAINQTSRTVQLTVPYQAVVTGLKATFTSSAFSNVYVGQNPTVGTAAVSGTSPAVNYTAPVTWTVEAENHSFDNYVVTVSKAAPSTEKSMLSFQGAWGKPWTGPCAANGVVLQTEAGTFSGTNVTFPVPFGANLDAMTVYFTLSPFATCNIATASAVDFDTNNDGTPDAVTFTVTAQSGSTQSYSVLPVKGTPSYADNLLSFAISTANSVVVDHTAQTITAVVPFSATTVAPTWTVSPYAHMFSTDPLAGPATEICSAASYTLTGATTTLHFWIQAEATSEVSHYVLTVTKAAASTANDITAIDATYSKANACGAAYTGTVIGSISGTTITFNVPFGVSGLTVGTLTKSALTQAASYTNPLVTGSTIVITSESGSAKTYTVTVTPGTASTNKQLLTYGFNQVDNAAYINWTAGSSYAGVIDQTLKRVTVTVPYGTDLYRLKAYFTQSTYACVAIAESNGTYTAQSSTVTLNDHSNHLTYVVTAEDGTQERYEIVVQKEAALTGNDLIGFQLSALPYCFGGTFTTAGTYTGNNIAVSVKYGTNLTSLAYSFTLSPGATVSGPASPANFTSPVTFTVTSQAGVAKTYTVTVTPRAQNTEAKLLSYWFASANNSSIGLDAVGTINETAKTVDVYIPWEARTSITALKASFTLSSGAVMTHSEDGQILQVSGSTENNFTTPVAYTVFPESCTPTVEYFVTVKVTPNVNTGISAFTFNVTPCATGCALVNKIDSYARRIYITVPYGTNLASLAPNAITVTSGATVTVANTNPVKPWNTAVNFSNGPVTYTVTAPDGVTKANWDVYVTAPKCTEHDILTFALPDAQVAAGDLVSSHGSPVTIDAVNHTINVIIKKGTNLSNIRYERTLSCGATICCVGGNCQDNQYLDFSQGGCHTCVVTAQDQTVTQAWTICVKEIDTDIPLVNTWSVMAYNCTDSVAVQSTEAGRVFIVNETALNKTVSPWVPNGYNLWDWAHDANTASSVAKLVANRLGAWATVTAAQVNTPVYVKTNGLYGGTYWAFSVDEAGRISCISDQKLFLDICDVNVATLCDLRAQPVVWRYTLTEEVFVTYEEARADGNIKYVQNATCGILIKDKLGALPSAAYGEGAGLTGLKGTLEVGSGDFPALTFVPVCCYTPTKSSTGHVTAPIELTYAQFKSDCYNPGSNKYESMLVKITTPMVVFDDYHGHPNWAFDNLDLATTNGQGAYDYFLQSTFNSPLIGKVIPTAPAYYQGIRTNVNWGSVYGLITPRKEADYTVVTAPVISANPNPVKIDGVLAGQCKSTTFKIYNEGVGNMNITALYLDDAAATDGFNLVTPPAVPFTIGTWANQTVTVNFCPLVAGNRSTNLIVEYGVGKTFVIPINGTTAIINTIPYLMTFNSPHPGASDFGASYMGWSHPEDNTTYLQNYVSNAWVSYDGSAVMNMRPRKKIGGVRYTTQMISPGFAVSGGDPVITWNEAAAQVALDGPANSPRNLYVSTNGTTWTLVDSYNSASMPEAYIAKAPWRTKTYSLAAYVGQTIWWKWELVSVANDYMYWCIDNIAVQSRITAPIIVGSPNPGDFGGVQVGATGTLAFKVKNTGISVLKVKKVQLVGTGYSLVDTNVYPVEVTSTSGDWAYTVGTGAPELAFTVNFSPADVGVKTGKIVVTYGLYSDMTYEIPLTGEGLSCLTAAAAHIGENYAPSQNTWFKYTADKFSLVQITSCNVHQKLVTNEYAWDTYLYVYSDCAGTLIGSNDDMEAACPYNRASSTVTTAINGGETVYIFWPLAFPTALHAYEGFYFDIKVTYPLDGDVCENAIPLTLPVVNHFGTTVGFGDDYNASPCSPFSNYMDGNDKVYTITVEDGYLIGNILGAYGSIHVLDVCPKTELTKDHCKAFVGGPNGGQFRKKIVAGTYFVIISTWAPPQTVDFLLNMSWESGAAVDNSDLMSSLSVYPNPTNGKFTVNISNPEATDMTLELVNISGQVVYRNEVKAAYSYNEDIDASSFAKGVYYLKVNDGKGVKVEKVVVQ